MADIYVGCTVARLPNPKIAASLRFFEFAPKPPLPSFATLARYRKQLSREVQVALVAPRACWLTPRGALRPGPELDAGLDWLKRAADILKAGALVLATGAELSTGERDRGLLTEFAQQLRAGDRLLVIAPRGLWEAEHGADFARQTHTVYGFDPLEDDAPEGTPVVYARVHPMGARPRLTDGHLAQIAERLLRARPERAYVSIESEQALRDARRLNKLLAETLGGADEQELADDGEHEAVLDADRSDQPEHDDEPEHDDGDGEDTSERDEDADGEDENG